MVDFKALLRKNMDETKKPQPVPAGTYRGVIKSYGYDVSGGRQTPYVRFECILLEAMDGVDTDDLTTALQGSPITSKKMRKDFYLTDEAMYRLKDFLATLGIDVSGRTYDEALPDTVNQEVLLDIVQTPSREGDVFYNNVNDIKGLGA